MLQRHSETKSVQNEYLIKPLSHWQLKVLHGATPYRVGVHNFENCVEKLEAQFQVWKQCAAQSTQLGKCLCGQCVKHSSQIGLWNHTKTH